MNRKRLVAGLLILLALSLLLGGCGEGLPDGVKASARALKERLTAADAFLLDQQKKFNLAKKDSTFVPLAAYAEKEAWEKNFNTAAQTLDRAKTLYETELSPLLKANKPESAQRVETQVSRIDAALKEARAASRIPFDRMARIRAAMTDTEGIRNAAEEKGTQVLAKIGALKQGPYADALAKFPESAQTISARFAPFDKLAKEAAADLDTLNREFKTHTASGNADYAAFVTAADRLTESEKTLETSGPKAEEDFKQLYKSYTKVLQDMKVDYYLIVKRESWDENSDYYDPRAVTFERQVSPAVYETLVDSPQDTIADITPSYFGKLSLANHVGSAWKSLSIDPLEQWPDRRHNAASFWIDDTREVYYHKYLEESDGETRETGWVKVNPSLYEQNVNNLGMAILSKPYGQFEPDTAAAPPGMAYVGNPAYGEWKKDERGDSFWAWYGRYALFSHLFFYPPSYYHYGSWNRWRTDYRYKKPYYGETQSGGYTYGTRGSAMKNSPRYQNTTFARTGGLKSAPASVRGGGAAIRGGGPKGRGK